MIEHVFHIHAACTNITVQLHKAMGEHAKALPLAKRALEIREAQLGPDHPDVAKLLNTQANLHYAQGRYEHADPLYRRALHITERRMGEKHPDVATALNNLASLLYQTRQYGAVWKSTTGLGGSPPNFRTLYLNQIEVDSADFWTNRLLSSSSRSTAKKSGPNRSITRTLKSG